MFSFGWFDYFLFLRVGIFEFCQADICVYKAMCFIHHWIKKNRQITCYLYSLPSSTSDLNMLNFTRAFCSTMERSPTGNKQNIKLNFKLVHYIMHQWIWQQQERKMKSKRKTFSIHNKTSEYFWFTPKKAFYMQHMSAALFLMWKIVYSIEFDRILSSLEAFFFCFDFKMCASNSR